MPGMNHHELEAAQRFVDGLLRQSAATDNDPALTERLIRIESVLRRAYTAFMELRTQQEQGAEELARLRERLRVVEALVTGRAMPAAQTAPKTPKAPWLTRWRAFVQHK